MANLKKFMEKVLRKPVSREVILYIFFGVLTTVISFGLYAVLLYLNFGIVLANTISHVAAILFAYITNKIWVFKALDFSIKMIFKEFFKFLSSRVMTYVIETLLLVILVNLLLYNPILSKAFTSVVIIILNYLLSKKIVFKGDA